MSGELPANNGSFYDYYWNVDKRSWVPWIKMVPEYIHDPAVSYYYYSKTYIFQYPAIIDYTGTDNYCMYYSKTYIIQYPAVIDYTGTDNLAACFLACL